MVACEDMKLQRTLVDQFCDHLPKPKTTSRCEKYNCPYAWIATPWSQCSTNCGYGTMYRNVTCHKVFQRGIVDPVGLEFDEMNPHDYCKLYESPPKSVSCNGNHCDEFYVWRAGLWSEVGYDSY